MKLTTVLLLAICLHVSASTYSQSITFSGKEVSMEKLFTTIKKQTGFVVWGKSDVLKQANAVTVNVRDMPLLTFLDLVVKDQPFNYKIAGNTIMLFAKKEANAPDAAMYESPVTGHVTDSIGVPLAGATVIVSGTSQAVVTNTEGNFTITASAGQVLRITFIGFKTKELHITAAMLKNGTVGNIALQGMPAMLSELNVTANTGYQLIPKERATGSFGIVTEKALGARMETSIMDRLEGMIPGMVMQNGEITIRGISTLYGNRAPLYVVDGFPYEGDLNLINPADVTNVTVMKDAAAASIYGTRAANGVISITTRYGGKRKPTVTFSSTLLLKPKPSYGAMHLLNSPQMVDLQQELFNIWHPTMDDQMMRNAQPKAIEALYKYEQQEITKAQLDATLNTLRGNDGQSQLMDLYTRNYFQHRYAFSAGGGNDLHQYQLTMNYTGDRGTGLKSTTEAVNIGLKEKVKVFNWLDAEAGVFTNTSNAVYQQQPPETFYNRMPYELLRNPDGSSSPWNYLKSPYEINRLKQEGLLDETYNPLDELDKSDSRGKSNYFRLQGGFTVKIIKGLSLDLKYQTERGSVYSKTYNGPDSYSAKNMINNATQIFGDSIVKNIPDGGQIQEFRGTDRSYTARAQLNFDRSFNSRHHISALAGAERRVVTSEGTGVFRAGYNDNNLQFLPINEKALGSLKGTEAVGSVFYYDYNGRNYFTNPEDRYISAYGNVGYTYNEKYNFTGSVRVDNSNLFGTDPRYRYLPLWSVGASWRISEEEFMKSLSWLSNLTIRSTYGLSGNVARNVGPYLQAKSMFVSEAQTMGSEIIYPPNKSLRWEKTAITNIGIDFGLFDQRISGSIDYYIRKSTDLLGDKSTDPTNAFRTALINYGSLNNKGIELALNTQNIRHKNFNWTSYFTLSLNKNRLTEINTKDPTIVGMTSVYGVNKIGYPSDAMFSFRSAGLDPTNGSLLLYDAAGKVVKNYDQGGTIVTNMTDINALVYSGTVRPKYSAGFTNTFSWQQLTLNIMIIANGGHVTRDAVPLITSGIFSTNVDNRVRNFWRKPGDEKIPGMAPAPDLKGNGGIYYQQTWFAADQNVIKADYIKVRDISLSYDFASLLSSAKKIQSAKFTLQVQNPFHWFNNSQGIDPESYWPSSYYANRGMPVMPAYMAGFDLTF
ncbi:MAG: SusC/RagA family TonB-linked outer membrane protein [Chitinophaga sp.]|uniref:SusC/RagA family TonB-linked outer membrane protein n=1 Tax=Chitinophaga sp. TaxID=1869181 RepID=UPI001B1854A5|nr:SusC/RagA family TonB-linked outer membrane protein [Chitinophaga sp.]MBO9729563.1 SusC/RagA family TonB-linked outer membrane protein [Chitinophaga sp.]